MKLLFVLLSMVLLMAQDTVPKGMEGKFDIVEVRPENIKVGVTACVAAVYMSHEHHVWVDSDTLYYTPNYSCAVYVTRTISGWEVNLPKWDMPFEYLTDKAYKSVKVYIRMTKVTFHDN